MAGYKVSNLYQGGYSSFKPSYGEGFTGYHVNANTLSTTTLPNTANVLKEFGDKLNMGIKNVEVTAINPQTFDEIPKQHFKEINRLSKLTGVDVSLHGILAEPSGMTQEGFNEAHRQAIERQIQQNLER